MLTITTADPNNTQAKLKLKKIIEVPRCPGKSRLAKTIINIPANTSTQQLDDIYQSLIDDDIDLYNPHLNVRDAYIRHVEQQNADLKNQITDIQDHLTQADRVIFGLLAALIVLALIAITLSV